MIIEGIEKQLIVRVRRVYGQSASDREAEKCRHVVLDHGAAYRVDLVGGQNIEQGRTGDKGPIAPAVGQQPPKSRLDAAIDDHRVVRQRQRSADGWIMIKMHPTLYEGKAGCQPALVGARPGTEIDDLQDAPEATGVDQIVDQFGEEAA
jgi:hypothetical protein